MSRWRRFSAIVRIGARITAVVRVRAETVEQARAAALAKAQKEARTRWPDPAERKVMTRDKYVLIFLFEGHVRDAV